MITVILKGAAFAALLVYAAATDIRRREVDGWVCATVLIISLPGTGGSFGGAVLTSLPFLIPALIKAGSVGAGDIKLMFACGAVLGVWGGMAQSIIGLACAGIYGLTIRITNGSKASQTRIPLAPFLCAGGIASYIMINMGGIAH